MPDVHLATLPSATVLLATKETPSLVALMKMNAQRTRADYEHTVLMRKAHTNVSVQLVPKVIPTKPVVSTFHLISY